MNSKTADGLRQHRPKAFLDVQRSGSPGAPRSLSETNSSEHTMWEAGKQAFRKRKERKFHLSLSTIPRPASTLVLYNNHSSGAEDYLISAKLYPFVLSAVRSLILYPNSTHLSQYSSHLYVYLQPYLGSLKTHCGRLLHTLNRYFVTHERPYVVDSIPINSP